MENYSERQHGAGFDAPALMTTKATQGVLSALDDGKNYSTDELEMLDESLIELGELLIY